MNKKAIAGLAVGVILVLAIVAFVWAQQSSAPGATNDTNTTTQNDTSTETTDQQASPDEVMIVYTNDGFAKSSITVKAGQTVRVQNNSDSTLSFNSDDHPTHTKQSVLNVGEIEPSESKTFTIDALGTWGYHDHFNSSHTGKIVVED